jgi:acyl-CoA thioesterase I
MRPATRRYAMLAVVAVAFGSLGLAAAEVGGAASPPSAADSPAAAYAAAAHQSVGELAPAVQDHGLSACEQRIERAQPHSVPRMAVVGASFTAGVGSSPDHSWAVLLASHLRWDAVVYGVPGAGYVRPGADHGGPVLAEVAHVSLHALAPSLVIVQAGHDDMGVPSALEQQRVAHVISVIRAEAPAARIVLLTVFSGRSSPPAAYRTDQAIITAARSADRAVIIIDPLTARWTFPHVRDGLHPTAAGGAWIAGQVAAILSGHGVRPAPAGAGPEPIICDHA